MYDICQRGEIRVVSLGLVGPEEAARIKACTGLDTLLNRRELDIDWIDHAFQGHGRETKIGQISIVKEDFERYAEIITNPHWIEPGQPGSLRYLRRYADGTVYAVERQVEGNTLSFRTMWKKVVGGQCCPFLSPQRGRMRVKMMRKNEATVPSLTSETKV